jgi:DNA-binding NarL/FixJ family response regulator
MIYSVLIADDNALIRKGVRGLFKIYPDFEICGEAENGADAVGRTAALHPDLIILDLQMPVMNGLEAADAIRQRFPQTPIILFTAYAGSVLKEEAEKVGIRAIVSKEDAQELVTTARSLCKFGTGRTVPQTPTL